MDGASPLCGDILLYQCRGEKVCDLIEKRIREVEPPVILIAHSLGGVACIDLLIGTQLSDLVPLVVTVGSQAPYFYEINALRSLEHSSSPALPQDFPKWVNVYDPRDFLSFVGADIFKGRSLITLWTTVSRFPNATVRTSERGLLLHLATR